MLRRPGGCWVSSPRPNLRGLLKEETDCIKFITGATKKAQEISLYFYMLFTACAAEMEIVVLVCVEFQIINFFTVVDCNFVDFLIWFKHNDAFIAAIAAMLFSCNLFAVFCLPYAENGIDSISMPYRDGDKLVGFR